MALASAPEIEVDVDETFEAVEDATSTLGRYSLAYEVASGGMATVYLARALGPGGFDRPVALKRIHPHLAKQPQFVTMFLDEARIAARITHPNVCTVFDFGEAAGHYYMAMEYLLGVPLSRLLPAVAGDPARLGSRRWMALAARIAADAAEGLHAAHQLCDDAGNTLGVVHRDVSPHNVFVTFAGAVKVVDFGIALAADRSAHTATGTVKGKFAYMAPEQAAAAQVDRRADVWSLGVCLWEMLSGRRLFKRENDMQTVLAIRSESIALPSENQRQVPASLDRIVKRALERQPSLRYASARELSQDLSMAIREMGEPCGMPELEELMGQLFAQQRAQRSEIVRTVMQPVDALPTKILARVGPVAPLGRGNRMGEGTASLAHEPTLIKPPPSRAWLRWTGIGVIATALLAIGLAGGVTLATRNAPGPMVTLPPVPAAAPPPEPPHPSVMPHLAPDPTPPAAIAPAPAPEPAAPSPRPPARVEHVATRYGNANVVAVGGWADIYEGRRRLGRTPLSTQLPVGRHVLTARPGDGSADRHVTVQVPREGAARAVVTLR